MKKTFLLAISCLILLTIFFSIVGCVDSSGQSSKDKDGLPYYWFYYAINDEHVTFGLDDEVTIDLYYWRDATKYMNDPDYAELYVSSHPGGMEDTAQIMHTLPVDEMELLLRVEEFYIENYPPIQYDSKEQIVYGEPTKTIVIPKHLFMYETGKILLSFNYKLRTAKTYLFYEKTDEQIILKSSIFSMKSYDNN